MPKVSVVMSVYNDGPYIREAVDSVLNQTFKDFEFIIVNDGSTDDTKDILLSYRDPRITLIDHPQNQGIPRSLNEALKLAKGKYIARQDGDDVSETDRLEKQVAFLEAHPDVALVGSWFREVDFKGEFLAARQLPCHCSDLRWGLLYYCPFTQSTVMFERERVSEQIGGYGEAFPYAQDYDLWSRIARKFTVANLPEYLVKYRINPSSITVTRRKQQDALALRIQKENIRSLLNSSPSNIKLEEMEPNIMTALFIDNPCHPNLQDVPKVHRTVKHILELQSLFCDYYQMSRAESKKHLQKLSGDLSKRLILIAGHNFIRQRYRILPLIQLAVQLNAFSLLSRNGLKLMLKMLIGPSTARTMQSLLKKG